jgi:conjugative relaxase-like TrwC/TraI family protein
MLRINQQRSADGAKSYFDQEMTKEGYYEKDAIIGRWGGKGAERLGLVGNVNRNDFINLCDNRNPNTGRMLTQRTQAKRTVGYDFTFNAPKSVSLLYTLTKDERILATFQSAVQETMKQIEGDVKTRVRQGGQNSERTTGNFAYAEFVHLTSRPVNGIPDPHLHSHCFVFNATFDNEESQWKAGQFREIVRDAPFFEAAFHSRLSKGMAELGLRIERTKTGWEVAGIGKPILNKFSRRTAKIEELARKEGITDIDKKARLGARTREKKGAPQSLDTLRAEWKGRLSEDERKTIKHVLTRKQPSIEPPISANGAVDHAIRHSFERSSVIEDRKLLTTALKRGYGSVTPEDVSRDFQNRNEMIRRRYDDRTFVTTREVLAEESAAVAFARDGRGTCRPFYSGSEKFTAPGLNSGQEQAVRHILTSSDRVMLIRGAAGTGKTTLLKTATGAIRSRGSQVHVFAPTTEAARGVLRKDGFEDAETVARLLADRKAQEKVKGQMIWVDEAGLLGSKDLQGVFRIAREQNARVVLMGDEKQHSSVSRGDAFRLLQTQAGLQAAEVAEIRRQKGEYKKAIELLANGNHKAGFAKLDRMGAIREVVGEERHAVLVNDYIAAAREGKSALVVAPTHKEGEAATARIREGLKAAGYLKGSERVFNQLASRNMTEQERRDSALYQPGDMVRFHQNAQGGFKRGDTIAIVGKDEQGRLLAKRENGKETTLSLLDARHFEVYERRTINLSGGDRIRITRNGTAMNGKGRLINGSLHTVSGFDRNNNIVLENGQVIPKNFGCIAHGYCTTSHASQGKTVDRVLVSAGPDSFGASSREQFYVSASRGKESATIYCENKREFLDAVSRSSARMTATELTASNTTQEPEKASRLVRLRQHLQRHLRAEQVRNSAETKDMKMGHGKAIERDQTGRFER